MRSPLPPVLAFFLVFCAAVLARAATEDPDTEAARRHFQIGSQAYAEKSYARALEEFLAARRAKALPALDFNIARCYDRLERYPEAIDEYERYLASKPGPEDEQEVTSRIATLRDRLEQEQADRRRALGIRAVETPSALPSLPVSQPAPNPWQKWLGPSLLGLGAIAALGVGTGLVLSVGHDYDRVKTTCAMTCPEDRWQPLQQRANAGYALWAVGGAVAAGDVAYFVVTALRKGREPGVTVAPLVSPTAGGLVAAGRF